MNNYFPHDYHARNDLKMIKLKMEMGDEGIGIYWQIIEMLYENNGRMPTQYDCIANVMRTQYELIVAVITKYDLFVISDVEFYSNSVIKRLEVIAEKSQKARESVKMRWDKEKTSYDRITNKGKERKVKERKVTPVYSVGGVI